MPMNGIFSVLLVLNALAKKHLNDTDIHKQIPLVHTLSAISDLDSVLVNPGRCGRFNFN